MTRIKHPDNIKQGAKLKVFLKEIKLTGLALSKEMGIEHTTLSRYISGYSKTPQEVIDYLYKKHKLNLEWWYTDRGDKQKNAKSTKSLVLDVGMINAKIEGLTKRIDEQDKLIKKLMSDLYSRNQK